MKIVDNIGNGVYNVFGWIRTEDDRSIDKEFAENIKTFELAKVKAEEFLADPEINRVSITSHNHWHCTSDES